MEVEIDLPKEEEALVEVQPEVAPVVSFVHIIDGTRPTINYCDLYNVYVSNFEKTFAFISIYNNACFVL